MMIIFRKGNSANRIAISFGFIMCIDIRDCLIFYRGLMFGILSTLAYKITLCQMNLELLNINVSDIKFVLIDVM